MSRRALLLASIALAVAAPATAQHTGGQIAGRVRDTTGTPVPDVEAILDGGVMRLVTDRRGEFVFVGVPPGVHRVGVRRIGYRPVNITAVAVQSGGFVTLEIELEPSAVELEPVTVSGERRGLVSPEVNATRETVTREALETLPVQTVGEVVDLAVGVTDGRFRGGRIGQAGVAVDGVGVKNPFSAQTGGASFEFSPSALQEVGLSTAGFGPEHAAALSGVVQLVTRTGPRDRWVAQVDWLGDDAAPGALSRGYGRLGLSAGGPLGGGITVFGDLAFSGLADADPRQNGLSCLEAQAFCFAERDRIPHQRGDRYTAMLKLDRAFDAGGVSLLVARNRDQQELYSTRYKYNLDGYLGERQVATLVNASGRWLFQLSPSRALFATAKVAYVAFDDYLGVPLSEQPGTIARFRFRDLRFRGEEAARVGQTALPGYLEPVRTGRRTPYGFLGSDLFVDDGTSGVAAWTSSKTWDLSAELQAVVSPQHEIKLGGDLKLNRIEHYETTHAWSPAPPVLAEISPQTTGVYLVNTLRTTDGLTVDLGARLEGFQPNIDTVAGLEARGWTTLVLPRMGVAAPLGIVGLDRLVARFNFGRYAQPPDFRFYFDTELDDSLNTAIRRQGNPALGFERATAYEAGLGIQATEQVAVHLVGYYKELSGITTSAIAAGGPGSLFTNLDFGTSRGAEARIEGNWGPDRRVRAGYAFSKTVAVVSSVFDSLADPTAPPIEVPLQFDRRHAIDLDGVWGVESPIGGRLLGALAGTIGSGFPVPGDVTRRLPWSATITARLTHVRPWRGGELAVFLEARNLLGLDNLRAVRPSSGGIEPNVAALDSTAVAETALNPEFPQESPFYIPRFDLDGDGYVGTFEQYQARRAALLDLFEPTLLYGEPRTVRLGLRWSF